MLILSKLKDAMELKASNKTNRYFLSDSRLETKLESLDSTILAQIKAARNGCNYITVKDCSYFINEYKWPSSIVSLFKASTVYANIDAMAGRMKPLFGIDDKLLVVNNEALKTPLEVESFFSRYNEAQPEGSKIEADRVIEYKEFSTILDYSEIPDRMGKLYKGLNSDGQSGLVFQILNLKSTWDLQNYLRKCGEYSDAEVTEFYVKN